MTISVTDCRDAKDNQFLELAETVRMYALYFMKDKDQPVNIIGHRHDWEFALVWTINDKLTHAYASKHESGDLKPISKLHFDAWCPECVKVVYHKDGPTTHVMRFADENEKAENHTKNWVKPPIVDWWLMPAEIRSKLNATSLDKPIAQYATRDFGTRLANRYRPGIPTVKMSGYRQRRKRRCRPHLTARRKWGTRKATAAVSHGPWR